MTLRSEHQVKRWLADVQRQQRKNSQATNPAPPICSWINMRGLWGVMTPKLLDVDHPSTLVVPLTTKLIDDAVPLRLRVPAGGDLAQDSDLLLDQLRAIDNNRLVKGPLQRCTEPFLAQVDQALREVLDLG